MKREDNEIEALKSNWRRDPAWDLEDTEGFEEHRAELKAFSDNQRAQWKDQAKERHTKLENMVCPLLGIGKEGYGYCRVEECAWWHRDREKCGVIQVY